MILFHSRISNILFISFITIVLITGLLLFSYSNKQQPKQPPTIEQNIVIDIVQSNIETTLYYVIIQDKRSGTLKVESIYNEQLQYFNVGDTLQ